MTKRVYMTMDEVQQMVIEATVVVASTYARLAQEGICLTPDRVEKMTESVCKSLLHKFIVPDYLH